MLAVDAGDISVRALLDLLAAFDTVDHDILPLTLQTLFGVEDAVLGWLQSF